MQLRETGAVTLTLSPVFLPRRGTSPGCLQALFRLGTYPGSFIIHSRMGRAAGIAGGGKGHTALSLSWSTPLSKFLGGVGAWPGAQACLYPTSTSDGQRRALLTCQLEVMAITNKGFSKEETQRLPLESWGRGGWRSSCLVRVHLGNTKEDRNDPPGKEPYEGPS